MADDIVQNIQITGIEDAIAQLRQLGDVGSQSFNSIAEAAERSSSSTEDAGEAFSRIREHAERASEGVKEFATEGSRSFRELGESAERFTGALSNISAVGVVSALEGLSNVLTEITSKLGPVGQGLAILGGAFTAITAGVAAATFGLYEFAKSAAETTLANEAMAKSIGATGEELAGIKEAFAEAGAATEGLNQSFRILGVQIASVWPEIEKNVREIGNVIEEDQIKIREASAQVTSAQDQQASAFLKTAEAALALADAQRKAENTSLEMAQAAQRMVQAQDAIKQAHLGTEQAALSVERAEYNLQLAYGAPRDKERERILRIEEAELAVKRAKEQQVEASHRLAEATLNERKAQVELTQAQEAQVRNALSLQKAQIEVNTARREEAALTDKLRLQQIELTNAQNKAREDQLKSIPAVAEALRGESQLFAGIKGQADLAGISTDTLFKSIIFNAAQAKNAIGPSGQLLAPEGKDVILAIADAMSKITDESQKQALLRRAFGRSATEQEIKALENGAPYFRQHIELQEQLAIKYEEEAKKAEEFEKAQVKLSGALQLTVREAGLTFLPMFTEGLDKLRDALTKNRAAIQQWVEWLASKVRPVVDDIFRLLSGEGVGSLQSDFMKGLVKGAKAFYDAMRDVSTVLGPIISGLLSVLSLLNNIVSATIGWNHALEALLLWKLGGRALLGLGGRMLGLGGGAGAAEVAGGALAGAGGAAEAAAGGALGAAEIAAVRRQIAGRLMATAGPAGAPIGVTTTMPTLMESEAAWVAGGTAGMEALRRARTEAMAAEYNEAIKRRIVYNQRAAAWEESARAYYAKETVTEPGLVSRLATGAEAVGETAVKAIPGAAAGGFALTLGGLVALIQASFAAQQPGGGGRYAPAGEETITLPGGQKYSEAQLRLEEMRSELTEMERQLRPLGPGIQPGYPVQAGVPGVDPQQAMRHDAEMLRSAIADLARQIEGINLANRFKVAFADFIDELNAGASSLKQSFSDLGERLRNMITPMAPVVDALKTAMEPIDPVIDTLKSALRSFGLLAQPTATTTGTLYGQSLQDLYNKGFRFPPGQGPQAPAGQGAPDPYTRYAPGQGPLGGGADAAASKQQGAAGTQQSAAEKQQSAADKQLQAAQQRGAQGGTTIDVPGPGGKTIKKQLGEGESLGPGGVILAKERGLAYTYKDGVPVAVDDPRNQGYAGGGRVRGVGTGTSDSILARLSAGEFVVKADGSNLADAVAHFNGAVLSDRSIPRFAAGGPVSRESRSLTLVLEGRSYALSGRGSTIDALESHAVASRIASTTSRRPSWQQ